MAAAAAQLVAQTLAVILAVLAEMAALHRAAVVALALSTGTRRNLVLA